MNKYKFFIKFIANKEYNGKYKWNLLFPFAGVIIGCMTVALTVSIMEGMEYAIFTKLEKLYPDVVLINNESLVSIDFKGIKQSCVIDIRWLKVFQNKVKLILWYDNEWGYSNRLVDLIKLLVKKVKC